MLQQPSAPSLSDGQGDTLGWFNGTFSRRLERFKHPHFHLLLKKQGEILKLTILNPYVLINMLCLLCN